ncbi:MAG: hypothetical protein QM780_12340 [Hyphomicrobium sp.]|uniref:hypothetical protein n=1 Tax=Hyphomicrobium sp. TaxID=82 RepID=UPI0039E2F77E
MLDRPAWRDTNLRVPAPGIAPFLNAFNPATGCMHFWSSSAYKLGGDVAESWLHFLGERWLKDLRFPQQIAACKTADDVNVAVSEFWQQASKDYSAEFNQLADITWAAMRETMDGASENAASDAEKCCGKCSSK